MNSCFKYILALLLFGSNGIVASFISLASYEIVFLRTLIGSSLLLAIFFLTKQKLPRSRDKRDLAFIAASGIGTGASWLFLYEAYRQTGVGLASLLYYCGPVIVMALASPLFGEKLTRLKLVCFAAVICGLFLVNGQALSEGKTAWGLFCAGMSAVMYAVMVIFNKMSKNITGLANSTLQLSVAFLTIAVFVGVRQGFVIHVPANDWAPVLALGLLNTGAGCYLYFSSIGNLPAQTVAVCGYLEPLSAVIFSVAFLNEHMSPPQIAGAILILGGAALGAVRKAQ